MTQARPNGGLEPIRADYLRSLSDHAHAGIRAAILSGMFAPGRRLRERQLADELGISTTPIKEALKRLELEGLIATTPRRGTFVRYSPEKSSEMALIRASLESVVGRLAATKITDAEIGLLDAHLAAMRLATRAGDFEAVVASNAQFHQLIDRIADNAYLRQSLQTLKVYDELNRRQVLRSRGEAEQGLAEHTAIFAALAARDPERAETLMRQHILRSAEQDVGVGEADSVSHASGAGETRKQTEWIVFELFFRLSQSHGFPRPRELTSILERYHGEYRPLGTIPQRRHPGGAYHHRPRRPGAADA